MVRDRDGKHMSKKGCKYNLINFEHCIKRVVRNQACFVLVSGSPHNVVLMLCQHASCTSILCVRS